MLSASCRYLKRFLSAGKKSSVFWGGLPPQLWKCRCPKIGYPWIGLKLTVDLHVPCFKVAIDWVIMGNLVVSINGDTPNGLFIMENLMKMDDKWGTPILGNPHLWRSRISRYEYLDKLSPCSPRDSLHSPDFGKVANSPAACCDTKQKQIHCCHFCIIESSK